MWRIQSLLNLKDIIHYKSLCDTIDELQLTDAMFPKGQTNEKHDHNLTAVFCPLIPISHCFYYYIYPVCTMASTNAKSSIRSVSLVQSY